MLIYMRSNFVDFTNGSLCCLRFLNATFVIVQNSEIVQKTVQEQVVQEAGWKHLRIDLRIFSRARVRAPVHQCLMDRSPWLSDRIIP